MTPAEKMGLKVGDKVRVTGDVWEGARQRGVAEGSIITLCEDDGSSQPMFASDTGYKWYHYLKDIEIIPDSTKVTDPATITVAAGETITFDGNATVKQDWVPKFGDRVVFVNPPSGMVGEFGVVVNNDRSSIPYRIAYNDGGMYDHVWVELSGIKPYEAE